ncbi:cytochrome P450 2J6-like [Glandiceps talaboti]
MCHRAILIAMPRFGDTTSLLLAAVVLVILILISRQNRPNLPPGPTGWPILGSLPFLAGKQMDITLTELGRKYGDVYSIMLGSYRVVILNSFDVIKEALVKRADYFNGRPMNIKRPFPLDKGVARAYNDSWKEHRRFALSTLRDFGMGKAVLEDKIMNEANQLMTIFDNLKGNPINPSLGVNLVATNVVASVSFGKRYDYDDPTFQKMNKLLQHSLSQTGSSLAAAFLPFLRFIPGVNKTHTFMSDARQRFQDFIGPLITDHWKTFCSKSKPSDLMDSYLKEMTSRKQNGIETTMDEETLMILIFELFVAGADTTASTLNWAILYMAINPRIQQNVQREIDGVLGRETPPSMADRKRLPYTEATIYEVHRLSSVVPLSLAHATTADVSLRGYCIPKGTYIIPNLWAVHNDPKLWPEPEVFKPERFIGEDGSVMEKQELIPFGIGPRICLGLQMAKMELFIFFTTLMQHYTFTLPNGTPPPSTERVNGLVCKPKPYKVCILRR